MEHKIIIGGFGGQGVMLMGQLLGYSACAEQKSVTYFPAYGSEQRGGTANCSVIISDEEIGVPNPLYLDTAVIMNQPSLDKFIKRVKPGGNLIVNSDMVKNVPKLDNINVYEIPIISIAREIGNEKCANLAMAGAIVGITKVLDPDTVSKVAKAKLGRSPELAEKNQKALERGLELGTVLGSNK